MQKEIIDSKVIVSRLVSLASNLRKEAPEISMFEAMRLALEIEHLPEYPAVMEKIQDEETFVKTAKALDEFMERGHMKYSGAEHYFSRTLINLIIKDSHVAELFKSSSLFRIRNVSAAVWLFLDQYDPTTGSNTKGMPEDIMEQIDKGFRKI